MTTAAQKIKLTPYIITAAIAAIAAVLVIPWIDMLYWPGSTYAEGFNIINMILALVFGGGLAITLYKGDRAKRQPAAEQAAAGQDADENIEIE